MSLFDLVIFFCVCYVAFLFWRFRAIDEAAQAYLTRYCKEQQLQLLSVARKQSRLTLKQGIDWCSEFEFEFSGNGEDSSVGKLSMRGQRASSIYVPPYRVS